MFEVNVENLLCSVSLFMSLTVRVYLVFAICFKGIESG